MTIRRALARRRSMTAIGAISLVAIAACGHQPGVVSVGAVQTPTTPPPELAPGTEPPATAPPISEPALLADIALDTVVDIDANRPTRDYDAFLAAAVTDIERFWGEAYPQIFGEPWRPLEAVYAGYPERDRDIPGCDVPGMDTTYEDLTQFAAFYCPLGDFIAFDDGPGGSEFSVLPQLTDAFGPAVLGVVLSHEYGHAVQERAGVLDGLNATIVTEQQADCYAGAWVGQAYRGKSPLLRLGDTDIRTSLIAMLEVRDPVGTDQFVEGGHGSAFDRVGAFQEGFGQGPARCAELVDDPLPLMPNRFLSEQDLLSGGNAPYDCEELRDLGGTDEDVANCTPAPAFLADDLNDFWATYLPGGFAPLTSQPVADLDTLECSDPVVVDVNAVLCPSTATVAYDEPDIVDVYREFGDFTLGYVYGIAWAERVQLAEGSVLQGEQRALLNDCYTGAWTADITPSDQGSTPRARDLDGDGFAEAGIVSSPGDLDEAIRMAILVGDDGVNVNAVGSPFEKIESFRVGVLGGLDACRSRFAGSG